MDSEIKVLHDGIEIIYDQSSNLWKFELRGRDRSAESLIKARDIIDTPYEPKKANTFKRFDAYRVTVPLGASMQVEVVIVTSIAEQKYGNQMVWIVKKSAASWEKVREKVAAKSLIPVTDKSTKIVNEAKALSDKADAIRVEVRELLKKVPRYEPKPE